MKRYIEVINNALQKNIKTVSFLIHKTNLAGEISISYWISYLTHKQKLGKNNQNYLNCSRMKSTALIITSVFAGWIIPSILFSSRPICHLVIFRENNLLHNWTNDVVTTSGYELLCLSQRCPTFHTTIHRAYLSPPRFLDTQ